MSYNSTYFWHCLLGNSIRFQRPRVKSYETVSLPSPVQHTHTQLEMRVGRPICSLCFWPTTTYRLMVPMMPFLGSINFLDHLIELRKPIDSLDYWFTKDIKEYLKINSQMRKYIGWDIGKGHKASIPFLSTSLPKSPHIHHPRGLQSFGVFIEVSLYRYAWLNGQ